MICNDKVQPLYTIYRYTDFLYRVVKFKRSTGGIWLGSSDKEEVPEGRLSQSYSRSRSMVLQYALCNKWDYFGTITIDAKKMDRFDLDSIAKRLTQWFRDYRKEVGEFRYVIIPERHKDGAWHFHGLFSGFNPFDLTPFIPGVHPRRLVASGYLNFPRFADRFGFCSFGAIYNPVGASFYIAKYITKEMANDDFYSHLYFCSRGLHSARAVSDVYQYSPSLDDICTFDSDFCSTGWAFNKDWTFPFSVDGAELRLDSVLMPASHLIEDQVKEIFEESWVEYEQEDLFGGSYFVES